MAKGVDGGMLGSGGGGGGGVYRDAMIIKGTEGGEKYFWAGGA
jgi:hypothetical protein